MRDNANKALAPQEVMEGERFAGSDRWGARPVAWRANAGLAAGLWLAAFGIAWLAGVAAQLQQAALWPGWSYPAIAAVSAAVAIAATVLRRQRAAASLLLAFGLAFGLTGWHAAERLGDFLDSSLEGVDLQLTGVVASMPNAFAGGVRFRFEVAHARSVEGDVAVPRHVQLAWYRDRQDDALVPGPMDRLEAGQRWRFTVRLRQPHGNLNPHGFDYELWLFEHGLRATGTIRGAGDAAPVPMPEDEAAYRIDRWRQRVREAIAMRIGDPRTAGVLAALAVGDQGAIDRDDWQLFRDTGIAHLMSISGLHVTMFGWLAAIVVSAAWRRSARLTLAVPAPSAARWGGLLAALAYAVFSGWGVPAQRTVWMLFTAALLASSGRRWPWPLVLLAAAVVVSAIDPWALVQPGFWLSFAAVGLLLASTPAQPGSSAPSPAQAWTRRAMSAGTRAARDALRTQTVATLGLTPLTLVFFHQASVVGLIANLVAIPLVTLIVTPLALLGVAVPWLWTASAGLVRLLGHGLEWLASFPGAVWSVAAAPWWAQAAGLAGGALAVLPLPVRVRLLAAPLALPLLFPNLSHPAEGKFEMLAADVGQGTAVLVRTHSHLLLYDTGPQYSSETDAGQRVLVPLLRARGEARIDVLMLSHRDSDHVGGAAAVMRALPVVRLSSSLEAGHPLLAMPATASRCEAGQHWQWDGVRFEVLHPPAAMYERPAKPNALSCVLRVGGKSGSVLLTGDIEREQELAIVATHGTALKSDLMLMPHHGSRTSSTPALLDAASPATVVAQAGYRNRFGHPRPDVVARYVERGIRVVETPACGAFRWTAEGDEAAATCQRSLAKRYWHHAMAP